MKKLTVALLVALTSCTSSTYEVKLKNGSVVKTFDYKYRNYSKGDTVCVVKSSDEWHIDEYGNMQDTIIVRKVYDSIRYVIEYRIGVIK